MAKQTTKKATAKKASTKKVTKKTVKKITKKQVAKKSAKVAATKKTPTKSNGNKTIPNSGSVEAYLRSMPEKYYEDSQTLIKIMSEITKEPPVMWGPAIIGFGSYHYVYESGREGDFLLTGFSPRASALSLYIMCGLDTERELMSKLGKYKTGKSCLYVKSLDDIHIPTLKKLIRSGIKRTKAKYG